MTRIRPVLVVSRDESTQDRLLGILRDQRIASHGVSTYGAALALHRHIRIGAVVLDILDEADWEGCVLLRRVLHPSVALLTLTSASGLHGARLRAYEIGCAGVLARNASAEILARQIEAVARPSGTPRG